MYLIFYLYDIYFSIRDEKSTFKLTFHFSDDEGIVVDLHGNKVHWYEIKAITCQNFQGSKSTLISPHYTHHENIRIRYKRWLPTIAHSIYWFSIEKPKDYHKNLMIAWEEKRTNKNKRLL